jgi:glycine/D-amino acid oxidase-like deaminating enzyme/nitrite reductase/ring-hydroxylating ferredoxin subunit
MLAFTGKLFLIIYLFYVGILSISCSKVLNIFRRINMSITESPLNLKLTRNPESYWIASTDKTDYPTLKEDITVDVAIVGGGLVGITTAFLLKKEGLKVAVLEADHICQGTTGHTTAKLTSQHDLIYDKLKNQLGDELAQQYADANETAIQTVADIVKEYNIDCDFSWQFAYVYTQSDQYVQQIMNEAKAASSLGIKAYYEDNIPLPFSVKAALKYDNQAQYHPRKFVLALAKMIPGDGSYIYEQTRAVELDEGTSNVIRTKNGNRVSANMVVIASHFPFYDGLGLYPARMYPERSYLLGVKIKEKFPGGMYISAESPGRSLRSQKFGNGEIVLVGGEHHKTGHGENLMSHYENLRNFAVTTFDVEDIMYRWSTQDYVTHDEIPYVGHLTSRTPNIYVATGFRKWGMTNSIASAMIIRDLITKGQNSWQDVYNPSRPISVPDAAKLVTQNAHVVKGLISGKLAPIEDNVNIGVGEGKMVDVEGNRVGAYRDEKGNLHIVDITCTHAACELKWNDAEKTWDCPCHGSRYTYEGDIVEGPTHKTLNHLDQGPNKPDPNFI